MTGNNQKIKWNGKRGSTVNPLEKQNKRDKCEINRFFRHIVPGF